MWNGFWKLTVMVGVIGVGLFAAYQAQKGMNRSTASVTQDASGETDGRDVDRRDERVLPGEITPGEPSAVVFSKKKKPRAKKSLDDFDENGTDSFVSVDANQTEVQLPKTERKKVKQVATADQEFSHKKSDWNDDADSFPDDSPKPVRSRKRASFGDNEDGSEQDSSLEKAPKQRVPARTKEPGRLPHSDLEETKPLRTKDERVQQVRDEVVQESDITSDSNNVNDPFASGTSTTDDSATAVSDDSEPLQQLQNQPGIARIHEESADELSVPNDIPRSKRAMRGNSPAIESIDSAAELFNDDQKSSDSQIVNQTNRPIQGERRSQRTTDETDDANPRGSKTRPSSSEKSMPKSLPGNAYVSSEEETPPVRPRPQRNRQVMPADLDDGLLDSSPPPVRESIPPRKTPDVVTTVDLQGDGEIGEASQRGVQQPRISIEKIAQQQAVLGQELVYSIIVKNTGTVDAHDVVIEDRIPKGSELVGTKPRAEMVGKRLIWNSPLLKPNEETRISIKVIPRQEGPIGSVAQVHFTTAVSAEIQVAAPQLDFTVKSPREVRVGQQFDMTFNLKNIGKVDATGIIVRDLVPDYLKNEMGADIECPIGKLAPGEIREIVLPVTAIKTGSVVNRAVLTAESGVKKELSNAIDIVGETLVLTRTGQNRLYVERSAAFSNNVRNEGNLQAARVRISEVVPVGMEFETASDNGQYDPTQRAVIWTLGPLDPGTDKTVIVKYVPKSTGTFEGIITAVGSQGSKAAVKATVDVIGKPELQMETLSATGTVTVGEQITSKFQLRNSGTASAQNVQMRIRLPHQLRLVKVKGAKYQQTDDYIEFDPILELLPKAVAAYELLLEPIEEADARIGLEITANHLNKPHRREETVQIARDQLNKTMAED